MTTAILATGTRTVVTVERLQGLRERTGRSQLTATDPVPPSPDRVRPSTQIGE